MLSNVKEGKSRTDGFYAIADIPLKTPNFALDYNFFVKIFLFYYLLIFLTIDISIIYRCFIIFSLYTNVSLNVKSAVLRHFHSFHKRSVSTLYSDNFIFDITTRVFWAPPVKQCLERGVSISHSVSKSHRQVTPLDCV